MNYDEMSDEEFNNLTPEEHTKYLIESYKNIRKIEILEKLPLVKWTKYELLDMLINFDLLKSAGSLKAISIDEFIKSGEYKDLEIDFEEYKIIEEMQNIFMYDIKKLKCGG